MKTDTLFMKNIRHTLTAISITAMALLLTACTDQVPPAPNPLPTVTKTITTPASPAPTITVTAQSAVPHLLPTNDDIANLAYRSGMAGPTTQFTVPVGGYQILYICYTDGLGDATDAAGYEDTNEGGSKNAAKLTCDSKLHTATASAAYVKQVNAVNKLTKITLTGDRMFVSAIDMSIRPLAKQ